jgi:hypothetical protein
VVVGGDPVHLRERGTAPVRVVVDGRAEGALAQPVALDRRRRLLQDRAGRDDEVGRRHRLARLVDTHDLEAEALGHLAHVEVLALAPPVVRVDLAKRKERRECREVRAALDAARQDPRDRAVRPREVARRERRRRSGAVRVIQVASITASGSPVSTSFRISRPLT